MISVVGAGPAGCIAARSCAESHDTVLYETQDREKRRVQCSGLFSRSGLLRIGINPASASSKSFIQNSVRGAKIYSPGGFILSVDGGREKHMSPTDAHSTATSSMQPLMQVFH